MLWEMEVSFADERLDRLETDPAYTAGFSDSVVRAFRLRMGYIRAADDERAFYGMKSLHFEKLKGSRQHQHSMRLNNQYRLIVEITGRANNKVLTVIDIADYH